MPSKSLSFVTLCLVLFTEIVLPTVVIAQSTNVSQPTTGYQQKHRRSLLKFKVPGIRGSGNLEAGAARGACSNDEIKSVLPPKPATMKNTEIPVELTVSNRPTFFIDVPKTSTNQGIFVLQDEAGEVVLPEKKLRLTNTPSIVSYTLPQDFQGLVVGHKYQWYFSLSCDPVNGDRSGDAATGGWIQRVAPSQEVAQKLRRETGRDRIAIYAENGYWHDALKTLADLRVKNPKDQSLGSDWSDLFQSVGLEQMAPLPVVQLETIP